MIKEEDLYSKISPPKPLLFVGLSIGLLVFLISSKFSSSSLPFFAMLTIGVITLLIGLTWQLRSRRLLWLMLLIVLAVHAGALWIIPWPHEVSYGIAFAPILLLDILIFWRLIIAVLKITDTSHS
jgi:hypothetical protein